MPEKVRHVIAALGALALSACIGDAESQAPDLQKDAANWVGYGRGPDEQHFSPLDEIDTDNIGEIGLAWSIDLEPGNPVTVPIAIDGTLYYASGHSVVHAVDAETGTIKWVYDPEVAAVAGQKLRQGWGSRGIAYSDGKVFTATADGRLIAIDVKSGLPVWTVQTLSSEDGTYISGAPRVLGDKIIIGNGGADSTATRGYVSTYDAATGKFLWRFFIVPGEPSKTPLDTTQRLATSTWHGEWWKYGGGGHAWNAFAYDPESDTVFVGTGNGSPWNHKIRSEGKGDNLFLCSIVALDASTGAYKWHYQVNPGETWDYNAAMDMHLANILIDGKTRKVLLQAPKNGFLYVLDRETGDLLSAEKIAKVTWADRIDLDTGRPVEVPAARFPDQTRFEVWPSAWGSHSAMPSAYSPETNLMYVPVTEKGWIFDDRGLNGETWSRTPGNAYDMAVNVSADVEDPLDSTGWLVAYNPSKRTIVWKKKNPGMLNGGILATNGNLVFQGDAAGAFNAYSADRGEKLWSFPAQAPVFAAPITYLVKGKQYITVFAGSGLTAGLNSLPDRDLAQNQVKRVLTFAIGGKARLPEMSARPFEVVDDPEYSKNPDIEAQGAVLFAGRCLSCHGFGAVSGGTAPDLRGSFAVLSPDMFSAIVQGGALLENGMPIFDELSKEDLAAIRQYIRSRAKESSGKGK